MWEGKYTKEMDQLFTQYAKMFGGDPDGYDDIAYEGMSYDKFLGYIKECLEKHKDMPEVIGGDDDGFMDRLGWK